MSMPYQEPSYQDLWNYFVPPPLPLPPPPPPRHPLVTSLIVLGTIMLSAFLCSFCAGFSGQEGSLAALVTIFVLCVGCFTTGFVLDKRFRKQASSVPPQPTPPLILTDSGYETWVASKQASLLEYGKQKLDLREEQIQGKVLVIRSLIFPDSQEARYYRSVAPIRQKRGQDGRWHTSINRFLFLYPTRECLAIFQCDVNALAPSNRVGDKIYFFAPPHYEGTSTYFYDDIVGIDTYSYLSDERNENGFVTQISYLRQHLAIRISNGKSILATTHVRDARVEKTVELLRILLREKYHGQMERKG